MSDWKPWDWLGYALLFLAAFIMALQGGLKDAPAVAALMPNFFSSEIMAFVPLIFLCLATAAFLFQHVIRSSHERISTKPSAASPLKMHTADSLPPAINVLAGPTPSQKMFTEKTIEELLGFFDERTPLQASPLIKPYLGMWIRVDGIVMMTLDGGIDTLAILRSGKRQAECRFQKSWEIVLQRYDKGNRLHVLGRISPVQNGQQFYMTDCEVVIE